jgi:hypothetical protein
MDPITMPGLLSSDQPRFAAGEHEATPDEKLRDCAKQLEQVRHYGRALWQQLDTVRHYLVASLPPDPHLPNAAIRAGAAPTGPDDDSGWNEWISAYASTISALAGPQGDSGYGLQTAQHEAQNRRSAEVVGVHARHANLDHAQRPVGTPDTAARPANRIRTALNIALVILALRGLRPRSRRS